MKNLLSEANSADKFRTNGHQLIDLLADHLETTHHSDNSPTIRFETPEDQLNFWKEDFNQPILENPNELLKKVVERSINVHSRRFFGHQVAPAIPISALTTAVASMLSNGMAVYEMGMVGNSMEKIITEYIAKKFGYGDEASGLITSGGTLGNLTALLAARAATTQVWEDGNSGGNNLAIMVSEEAHYCVERAARIMGLGSAGTIKIPVDENFGMRTDLLEEYLNKATLEGKKVFCIVGSACSTATGSYDDLAAIASFAKKHNIWFHVDGAHGGAAIFSAKYKHLLKGVEDSNSLVLDFHKMMMVPALSTAVIFRNGSDAYNTFSAKAHYLWEKQGTEEWYNSGKRTFECTKPMSVLSIYTIIRMYGESIFQQNVDSLYDMAKRFAHRISNESIFELAGMPQSNIVCFRVKPSEGDADLINQQILQDIIMDGRFYIVSTRIKGEFFLRTSIMNSMSSDDELIRLIELIKSIVKDLRLS